MAPPAPPGTTGLECSTSFHEGSKLARLCATSCCRGATSRCIVVDGVPIILVSVYICHITDWCEEIMLTEHVSFEMINDEKSRLVAEHSGTDGVQQICQDAQTFHNSGTYDIK